MHRLAQGTRAFVVLAARAGMIAAARRVVSTLNTDPLPEVSRAVRASDWCPPEESADFPAAEHGLSAWSWYTERMAYMREPILGCGPSADDETYRFTWVHAFSSQDPLSIRVSRRGTQIHLVGRRYKWSKGPSLSVTSTADRHLSENEWSDFEAVVRDGFWNVPGYRLAFGNDGATWMIEGRTGTRYHLVIRWEPKLDAERRVALALMRLAGFALPR